LFLVVGVCTIFGMFVLSPLELAKFAISAVATVLGVSNIYFFHAATQYFSADAILKPLLMTWSLGVEEQFYVGFPILLVLLYKVSPRHIGAAILLMTLGSLAFSIYMTPRAPALSFFLPISRAWELGAGTLLAIWQARRGAQAELGAGFAGMLSLAGVVLLAVSLTGIDPAVPFPGWRSIFPVFGTLALIASQRSFVNRKVLAAPPLVGLGLVSYSWYLWHWPLFSFANLLASGAPPRWIMLGLAVISLVAAVGSWRFVEQPFRRGTLPRHVVLRSYGLALGGIVVVMVEIDLDHGINGRFDGLVGGTDAQIAQGSYSACLAGYGNVTLNQSAVCATPGAGPVVALIGDSHANALAPMLRQLALAHGLGFEEYTKSSCPALDRVVRLLPTHPANAAQCLQYNARVLAMVARDPRVKIVVMSAFWSAASDGGDRYLRPGSPMTTEASTDILRDGLVGEETAMRQAGKRVVVLGDVPRFAFDPAQRALTQAIPLRRMAHGYIWGDDGLNGGVAGWHFIAPHDDASDNIVRVAVAAVPDVVFVDPWPDFCGAQGCAFMGDGESLLYADPQHLSPDGSFRLLALVERAAFGV
jgi:peptidoglycan/LPS O-acetylase OafA/YrhL